MNKKIHIIISYMAIVLGSILASFSVACILLPNDAIDYGTAGIAIIISKLTDYNLSDRWREHDTDLLCELL